MRRSVAQIQPAHFSLIWPVTAALAVRIIWALLVPVHPVSDSVQYHEFARSIVSGVGFAFSDGSLTAYWPVGTSAVYAALYAIFGVHYEAVVALQVGLGTLLVLLTGVVARREFGDRVAATASWMLACWPLMIQMTTVLASELLFSSLVLLALWLRQQSWALLPRTVAWSAMVGLAIYVRPIAGPLVVLFALADYMTSRDWRRALLTLLVASLAVAAITYPWKLRNERLWGRSGIMTTNFGPNLWMGNNPASNGGYMSLPDRQFANESDRDVSLRNEAVDYIAKHPGRYLALSARRLVDTFQRETIGVAWNQPSLVKRFGEGTLLPLKLLASMFWVAMALLALIGLTCLFRRSPAEILSPMVLTPALFAAVSILVVSQDRYHMPMNPFIAMFAAMGLHALLAWRTTVGPHRLNTANRAAPRTPR